MASVAFALLMQIGVPHASAAPDVPDIDSLIDDSGPLPTDTGDLTQIPDLLFTTPAGLICKQSVAKVMHQVACAGDFPGAPAGTRIVSLPTVYDQADGPARFLPTPPERFFGDTSGVVPVLLPTGHKIVFWAFSSTRSLVCGVPSSTVLVCVLKAGQEIGPSTAGPAVTHGFVISPPQSQVF
jgi:hypothetical protein